MHVDPGRAAAARGPAGRRAAAAGVVRFGCEDRELDAQVARERRVLHHPPQEPSHACHVGPELVGKALGRRLHEKRRPDGGPVGGAQVGERLHNPAKRVVAGEVHLAVIEA